MTSDSLSNNDQDSKPLDQATIAPRHYLGFLAIFIALVAFSGVTYLFFNTQKQASILQNALQSYQSQITSLQAQITVQSTLQKSLSQLTVNQSQSNTQFTLSSVIYLVRMAHLVLILNQDSKAASHFLDSAQLSLKDLPSMGSLRASIIDQKQALDAAPNTDVEGVLMQLSDLKNQVMNLSNTPHWSENISDQQSYNDYEKSQISEHASANWKTLVAWIKRFVIISHPKNNPTILPTPEHFQSVKDSVNLDFSIAQWAVLHNNSQVYLYGLHEALTQLNSIAQNDPVAMNQILSQINALSKLNIHLNYPDLNSLINQITNMQETNQTIENPKAQDISSSSLITPTDTKKNTPMALNTTNKTFTHEVLI